MNEKPEQIMMEAAAKVLMTVRPSDRLRWVRYLLEQMDMLALQSFSQEGFEQLLHELQETLALRLARKEW